MSLVLPGATSGSITIASPAVAGTNTLTLPALTGTVALTGAAVTSAQLPTGTVLQVIQGTYAVETSNSTSTFADTGLTATITPKFATSKILVLVSHPSNAKSTGNAANDLGMQLLRGASVISNFGRSLFFTGSALNNIGSTSYNFLDSPATVSATTYKTQFKNEDNNGASVTVQVSSSTSTITLMEIAA